MSRITCGALVNGESCVKTKFHRGEHITQSGKIRWTADGEPTCPLSPCVRAPHDPDDFHDNGFDYSWREPIGIQREVWRKTWRAPDLGIVDEPMALSLLKYRPEDDRQPSDEENHNLVSSHVRGTKKHAPIIDLDFAHHYVATTQDGHAHLYLDVPISKWRWVALMTGLYLGGVIEKGYFIWSLRRGGNFARRPGVAKETDQERVTYTHGMFFRLREFRGKKR
jgi:hypothetical protein